MQFLLASLGMVFALVQEETKKRAVIVKQKYSGPLVKFMAIRRALPGQDLPGEQPVADSKEGQEGEEKKSGDEKAADASKEDAAKENEGKEAAAGEKQAGAKPSEAVVSVLSLLCSSFVLDVAFVSMHCPMACISWLPSMVGHINRVACDDLQSLIVDSESTVRMNNIHC